MRNAAATFDDDFGFDPPAPKKATRKPRPGSKGKKKQKRFSMDRVARYAAIGMSAAVAIGIMVNALMMQKGHHPAPLFASASSFRLAAVPAAPPRPKGQGAEMTNASTMALPTAAPASTTSAGKTTAVPQAPRDMVTDDPIARLLRGSPSIPGATDKPVLGAQKALLKLGFNVKANGLMGSSTKKAIEAFEKDRHLPVRGELSHKLIKVLAAESGLHID